MKFRKKPVVIEAVQWTGENEVEISTFCDALVKLNAHELQHLSFATFHDGSKSVELMTLEGRTSAAVGDWIIKGVNGEFYPCKPDIFAKTYDVVDESVGRVTLESRYRSALATLVGVHTLKELQDMEVIVRLSGMPAEEKTNILAAINLLIETAPKP